MRAKPWIYAALASTSVLLTASANGEGLATSADRVPWARFDARVVPLGAPRWRSDLAPYERSGLNLPRLGLVGDFYFGSVEASPDHGGFRATSGLVVGMRPVNSNAGADRRTLSIQGVTQGGEPLIDASTVPYLGVGYSNAWPKSGWRLSADLGLVSYSPGNATGIGRVLGGSQSLDDLVRDMRLAPVLQLGVSYSF